MFSTTLLSLALLPLFQVLAAPLAVRLFSDRAAATGTPTAFSVDTVNNLLQRPAQFARAAYCSSQSVTSLTCGPACDAIKGVNVLQSGGDDGRIPLYFIAFDPDNNSVVVAHQGTDPTNIVSIANDAQFGLVPLNTTLIPNAPADVKVHDGFQKTFQRTSDGILAGVRSAIASTGANKVVVTGHSLGAAIATMDAMMLAQNLGSSIQLSTVVFGLPRGGNQAWADFVDSTIGSAFTHVTNQKDPVPIVPPRFLDFQQPSGEVHIKAVDANGQVTDIVSCPGQDNKNCSEGNSVLHGSVANHLGPYFNNISFGGGECPS